MRRADAAYCTDCGDPLTAAGAESRSPAAGWYADPWNGVRQRWWDGAAWTWQVNDGTSVAWDPLPEAPAPPRAGVRGVGLALVGFGLGAGMALGADALLWWAGRPGGTVARLPVSEAGLWAGLLGACLFVSRRRGTGRLAADFGLRFRWVDLGLGLAGALAGRMMASAAVEPFVAFLLNRKTPPDQTTLQHFAHGATGWAMLALVTCVGAPLVEELFFRGLIQTRLVARWGPVTGIAVTSGLFGAAHLIGWAGPITFLYAWSIAAGGLALGTVRHLTGRLGTSMVAHSLFNAQALLALALIGAIR